SGRGARAVPPKLWRGLTVLARDRSRTNRRDGKQHTQADDDECDDNCPDRGNVMEEAGLPQREARSKDEDEVTNEVEVDEAHGGNRDGVGIREWTGIRE